MAKLTVPPPTPSILTSSTFEAKAVGKAAATSYATGAGARKKARRSFGKEINTKGAAVFTRQLSTLVKAGMPILRSLEVLSRQEKRPAFKQVLEQIADTIRSGGNFSDGLAAHERVFDRLYVNMIKAGEAGGVLGTVLERLSVFMEKAEKIKGKVKSAMIYPVIIVSVALAIVSVLMIFVVPKFQEIFTGLLKGQPLPALTQGLLDVSNFLKNHYGVAIGGSVAAYFCFKFFAKTRFGRRIIDWLLIHMPVIGDLFSASRRATMSPSRSNPPGFSPGW
ncbi:MAG: type II secretion system F family protein [Verrucomicrobia bacterium]|nr:type II secretion system F family protein [Verrucomicrobiota bacterium]